MVPSSQSKLKSQQTHRVGRVKEKYEDERSVAARRDRAYEWFNRLGYPPYDNFVERILREKGMNITKEDIDLLPWTMQAGELLVDRSTFMRLKLGQCNQHSAFEWFNRLGKPPRATFEAALEETSGIPLKARDIASLPWDRDQKGLRYNKFVEDEEKKSKSGGDSGDCCGDSDSGGTAAMSEDSDDSGVGDEESNLSGIEGVEVRRKRAREWYDRLKQPNRLVFRKIVQETTGIDIRHNDIDLLPWDCTYQFLENDEDRQKRDQVNDVELQSLESQLGSQHEKKEADQPNEEAERRHLDREQTQMKLKEEDVERARVIQQRQEDGNVERLREMKEEQRRKEEDAEMRRKLKQQEQGEGDRREIEVARRRAEKAKAEKTRKEEEVERLRQDTRRKHHEQEETGQRREQEHTERRRGEIERLKQEKDEAERRRVEQEDEREGQRLEAERQCQREEDAYCRRRESHRRHRKDEDGERRRRQKEQMEDRRRPKEDVERRRLEDQRRKLEQEEEEKRYWESDPVESRRIKEEEAEKRRQEAFLRRREQEECARRRQEEATELRRQGYDDSEIRHHLAESAERERREREEMERRRRREEAEAAECERQAEQERRRLAEEQDRIRCQSPERSPTRRGGSPIRSPKRQMKNATDEGRFLQVYAWYQRMGQPDRDNFKRRISCLSDAGITEADVELLPWGYKGKWVNVSKVQAMVKVYTQLEKDRGNTVPWERATVL